MEQTVREKGIRIAILAVPQEVAQPAADALVRAGVRSIVDFAAISLKVPEEVFVDHMDITSALESAAFFAREERPTDSSVDNGADAMTETEMEPIMRTIDSLLAGADMKLEELARKIGAQIIVPGAPEGTEVTRIYAGDRVSDLLNEASDKTLLITNLANVQMMRVAELMEVPGVCFVEGAEVDQEIVELAQANRTLIMVSPVGVFETCGLIYQILSGNSQS
jgi:hypothetical protein